MKKLYALALICTMPAVHAGSLEKTELQEKNFFLSSVFTQERCAELHSLRKKVLTAHAKRIIDTPQKDTALACDDLWNESRTKFKKIIEHVPSDKPLSFPTRKVLTAFTDIDGSLYSALLTIDSEMQEATSKPKEKEEEKKS